MVAFYKWGGVGWVMKGWGRVGWVGHKGSGGVGWGGWVMKGWGRVGWGGSKLKLKK